MTSSVYYLDWIATCIGALVTLALLRVGALQVREFRNHTGDSSWLTSLLALPWLPLGGERTDTGGGGVVHAKAEAKRAERATKA